MPTGFTYNPIGVVRSPHMQLEATPIQPSFASGFRGTVELEPRFAPGLDGIEGFSHIILIVALHAREPLDTTDPANLKVVPFLADERRGVFATRSPRRPNQIGLSIVRLLKREGDTLFVDGLDLLDGTPLLDVKPYVPQFDIVPDADEGWVGAVTSASAARRGRRTPEGVARPATPPAAVRVTVLVDDHEAEAPEAAFGETHGRAGQDEAPRHRLHAEHGLALWIETGTGSVLFDTGASDRIVANAESLDVPLREADAIVLSHGHYDHTGGLAAVLARARFARLVAHPAASLPRWSRGRDGQPKDVGMPAQALGGLAACAARTTRATTHVEILPVVHVTGPIPRRRSDERSAESFFLDREMTLSDLLPDDQALWIETERGPIVILGCAHSGVLTTLDHIAELREDAAVRALVGGMHLLHADEARLERTVTELSRRGVGLVAPGHCTGERATELLGERFAGRCQPLHVGQRLSFD